MGIFAVFLQNKPVQRVNKEIEEIHCILYEQKTAKNEWKNDHSDLLRA